MKIALAQFNPTIGDCTGNTVRIQKLIEKAASAGAQVVVLPELAVTGYPPQDLLNTPSFVEQSMNSVKVLAHSAQRITAVVGFVEKNPSAEGAPFFNSAAVLRDGKTIGVYRKRLLPSYDVFDDERYFDSGSDVLSFQLEGKLFAVTICEDIWNEANMNPRLYRTHPLDSIRFLKPDWVLNLSASPYQIGKPELRERLLSQVAVRANCSLLYCNQVGANDDLIFDGGSAVATQDGKIVARSKFFEEDLLIYEAPTAVQPLAAFDPGYWLEQPLVLGIRDYVNKSGGPRRVCLGLSGGVDSSVVAVLAAKALGSQNVKGVLLPSRFTISDSNEDALAIAAALGMETVTVSIEKPFKEMTEALQVNYRQSLQSLTLEKHSTAAAHDDPYGDSQRRKPTAFEYEQ